MIRQNTPKYRRRLRGCFRDFSADVSEEINSFIPKVKKMTNLTNKLDDIELDDIGRCGGCGRTINTTLCDEYWTCNNCKTWKYCEFCRFCPKQHRMQKVVNLEKIDPMYYKNKYSCDACNKNKQASDDGIWHCGKCAYDVCEICLE